MIWIGDDISVKIKGNNPHKTLIEYKEKPVGGIQEFVCNITVEKIECRCVLYSFDNLQDDQEASDGQKQFAAELVKHGFDVIWLNVFNRPIQQREKIEFKTEFETGEVLSAEKMNDLLKSKWFSGECFYQGGFQPSRTGTRFA